MTAPTSESVSEREEGEREIRIVEGSAAIEDLDEFLSAVSRIRVETGTVVQAFDGRYVVSRRHLVRAVELAERASARDEAVARDRAVEVLLYAAGRRQIDRALEMGVDDETTTAVVVIYEPDGEIADGRRSGTSGDDHETVTHNLDTAVGNVIALLGSAAVVGSDYAMSGTDNDAVREFFDVTEPELRSVTGDLADLILERVALLDVEK